MAFKMSYNKISFPFKKTTGNKNDPPTVPLPKGTKLWTGGTAPIVGGFGKVVKTFGKIVKNRASQSKIIQKLLEKKGKKFIDSPKSISRGNFFGPGK